jgi:hypothetical protein
VFFHASGAVLDKAPTHLRWRDRHTKGYPYFSGTIRLSRRVSLPAGSSRMCLPDQELMFAGVAELEVNGRSLGVRAWAPYCWRVPREASEVTLSITNTLIEQLEGKRYDARLRQVVPVFDPRTDGT